MKVKVYTTPTCGPCKFYKAQTIEPLIKEGYNIGVVDTSENLKETQLAGITGVPTTIIYNDEGKELKRFSGMKSLSQVKQILDN